ncbi:hypothetical protein [Xenorhabdus cabanillasii]|uniref:Secreted protein n=1 Tax=Xenorhabdus cabanillasii JM26 TaxID=1427517 RepID=W1INY0_9GAMM|nr:hypothetical protein [Xenorhabdus cabanillasii]PHM76044.1 hypothetical protein Xcab_03426 [Xenorhabdus cabanillasii JM26]CDL80207.1 exported hypothetical protein [Xenorhabdus cabanillasii JM26]
MKKLLAIGLLGFFFSLSVQAAQSVKPYEQLKPVASDIMNRTAELVNAIPDGYQNYYEYEDQKVWRAQRNELNTLSKDAEKLGDQLSSHFRHCINMVNAADNLWIHAMAKGVIDPSFFEMYTKNKNDCQVEINTPPSTSSNVRVVDLWS